MARIQPVRYEDASLEVQAACDALIQQHKITNMKATLLHSPPALHAVLEWYTLFDEVKPVLGERLAILFSHAISRQNDCLVCHTFCRRSIIDGGEDPEDLVLDERERAVVDFGRQLAADANGVSDELFARLEAHFTPKQIVDLTTFGALMIVNNIFNSALQIDLDDYLEPYRLQPEQTLVRAENGTAR